MDILKLVPHDLVDYIKGEVKCYDKINGWNHLCSIYKQLSKLLNNGHINSCINNLIQKDFNPYRVLVVSIWLHKINYEIHKRHVRSNSPFEKFGDVGNGLSIEDKYNTVNDYISACARTRAKESGMLVRLVTHLSFNPFWQSCISGYGGGTRYTSANITEVKNKFQPDETIMIDIITDAYILNELSIKNFNLDMIKINTNLCDSNTRQVKKACLAHAEDYYLEFLPNQLKTTYGKTMGRSMITPIQEYCSQKRIILEKLDIESRIKKPTQFRYLINKYGKKIPKSKNREENSNNSKDLNKLN